MRLFRVFLIAATMIFGNQSFLIAQKLTLSPQNLDDYGLNYLKVIGQDDNGVFVLHSNLSLESTVDRIGLRSRKYRFSYFDFNLKPQWWKNLISHPESATLEAVSFFNGKGFVISSDWNRSENNLLIYLDIYNSRGELEMAGKQIASLNIGRSANVSKPKVILSASKLYAGIYLEEIHDDVQTIHLITCDTSFKNIIQNKASINYPSKNIEFTDVVLSDQQDLSVLATLKERDLINDKKKVMNFKLFHLKQGEKQFKEFNVNDSQHPMNEASLAIDRLNSKIVVAGFYADKKSSSGAGILFSSLDLLNPVELVQKTVAINGEARIKLIGDRNSGNGVSIYNYPIQRIVLRNDGGVVLIAEAAYLSEYSYYDYFTQSFNRRVEYHYDNVVVLSISPLGEVAWSQVLRKDQASIDDEGIYASFSSFLNADQLTLIYNGNIGRENEVESIRIDNQGQSETKKLSKISDRISLLPRAGKQIDDETIIVPAINKKKMFLAKIVFE